MTPDHLDRLLTQALDAQTPAEKWALIEEAWVTYCHGSAGDFDWDYDSRDLMKTLTGHGSFGRCDHD